MAYIKFIGSDSIEHLHNPHLFGRNNPSANSSLNSNLVSRNHASIEWGNETWLIQDLSRNGTWVNNTQIEQHAQVELHIGDIVKLGNDDDSCIAFEVCDLAPPCDELYRPHPSLQTINIQESNLIPSATSPDFGFYYCQDRQNWFSQSFINNQALKEFEQGPHSHGDEIRHAGNRWHLFVLNGDTASSQPSVKSKLHINDIEFRIMYNNTEDDIRVSLISPKLDIELGERRYNQLMSQLIQLQQKSNDGWVTFHSLMQKSKKDQNQINFLLFLLRHDISLALPRCKGISNIIQRKDDSLRIGVENYAIYRGGKLDQSSDYDY